ncbi:MAG: prepilin-type N-terminal cleavage/methylation domain-containing protein [Actinomycetota bacterium]
MRARIIERRGEEGFTLIELMVVVLIIGILIAIALGSFLGARRRAENRAAQTDVRSGLIAAMSYYTDGSTFAGFDVPAAVAAEPQLRWIGSGGAGGGAPAIGEIKIEVASATDLLLITQARSGMFWCLAQVAGSPVTLRGGDVNFANVDTVAECNQGW